MILNNKYIDIKSGRLPSVEPIVFGFNEAPVIKAVREDVERVFFKPLVSYNVLELIRSYNKNIPLAQVIKRLSVKIGHRSFNIEKLPVFLRLLGIAENDFQGIIKNWGNFAGYSDDVKARLQMLYPLVENGKDYAQRIKARYEDNLIGIDQQINKAILNQLMQYFDKVDLMSAFNGKIQRLTLDERKTVINNFLQMLYGIVRDYDWKKNIDCLEIVRRKNGMILIIVKDSISAYLPENTNPKFYKTLLKYYLAGNGDNPSFELLETISEEVERDAKAAQTRQQNYNRLSGKSPVIVYHSDQGLPATQLVRPLVFNKMQIPLNIQLPIQYFVKEERPTNLAHSVFTWKKEQSSTEELLAELKKVFYENFMYSGIFKNPEIQEEISGTRIMGFDFVRVKNFPGIPQNLRDFLDQLTPKDSVHNMVAGLLIKYKFPVVYRMVVADFQETLKPYLVGPLTLSDTIIGD